MLDEGFPEEMATGSLSRVLGSIITLECCLVANFRILLAASVGGFYNAFSYFSRGLIGVFFSLDCKGLLSFYSSKKESRCSSASLEALNE